MNKSIELYSWNRWVFDMWIYCEYLYFFVASTRNKAQSSLIISRSHYSYPYFSNCPSRYLPYLNALWWPLSYRTARYSHLVPLTLTCYIKNCAGTSQWPQCHHSVTSWTACLKAIIKISNEKLVWINTVDPTKLLCYKSFCLFHVLPDLHACVPSKHVMHLPGYK